jgi:hypothetical protein
LNHQAPLGVKAGTMHHRPVANRRSCLRTLAAAPFLWLPRGASSAEPPALPAPELFAPERGLREGWTMAVLPDTQNYAKYAKNQAHFVRMCRWLAENLETWRIRLVLHEGDFVEQNGIPEGGGRGWGDQNGEQQWLSAKRALSQLEGRVPTVYTTGNHDYGLRNAETRETRFNEFFPLTANPLTCDGKDNAGGRGIWVESAPNSFGQRTAENAAYDFTAPDGRKFLLLSLEWGPRRAAVEWAREVAARPRFAGHTGLLLVHDFVTPANLRDGQDGNRKRSGNPHTYPTGRAGDTHDGEDLWQSLVRGAPQVQLVLNGHEMASHVGRRTDPNDRGLPVHQMLFNAQGFGGGSDEKGNGGDGWLRLLTFEPDGVTLSVRTFSPLKLDAGDSPWWDHPSWRFRLRLG